MESTTSESLQAWRFVQQMLADLTQTVIDDAEDERELVDGLRVLSRVAALCSEISIEADPDLPWFFDMCSPTRLVGGPNPDGNYFLAMIRGDRVYRVTGKRGGTAYLGFQVLAGSGMAPRRMAGYVSDTDLKLDDGEFALVFSADEPHEDVLDGAQWVPIPADAVSIVVREYIGDRAAEEPATLRIDAVDAPAARQLSDAEVAEQFTAMAWTLFKLATLHRTVKPELLTRPNELVTAGAAELGAADTTPDNLYMIGTFALEPNQYLRLDITPPETRYWNVTLENVWHECIQPRRRRSSITDKAVRRDDDAKVRITIGAKDFGEANWLDTAGLRRGFVVLRWLDNPEPPDVLVTVHDGPQA